MAVDFGALTSGFYEEALEVQNVSDGRVSLDYDEYQVRLGERLGSRRQRHGAPLELTRAEKP